MPAALVAAPRRDRRRRRPVRTRHPDGGGYSCGCLDDPDPGVSMRWDYQAGNGSIVVVNGRRRLDRLEVVDAAGVVRTVDARDGGLYLRASAGSPRPFASWPEIARWYGPCTRSRWTRPTGRRSPRQATPPIDPAHPQRPGRDEQGHGATGRTSKAAFQGAEARRRTMPCRRVTVRGRASVVEPRAVGVSEDWRKWQSPVTVISSTSAAAARSDHGT